MRLFLMISFLYLFVTGCGNDKGLPRNILPQKKMQGLLWDLMRADQYLGTYVFNKDSTIDKTAESLKYYQQVFVIHDVSREEFQKSFAYYRQHPELFKAIMDSISTPDQAADPTLPIIPKYLE